MTLKHIREALCLGLLLLTLTSCQNQEVEISETDPTPLVGAPIDSAPSPALTPGKTNLANAGLRKAPTDPAQRALLAVDAPEPKTREGYRSLTFATLADFEYPVDETGVPEPGVRLPDSIAALDNTRAAVSGFLVPIEFEGDKVSSLILVRNQLLCCYGEDPALNEWVWVNVDPPVEAVTDVPVTLTGTFYASPDKEGEQVISLYRMQASDMEIMQ